MAAVKSHAWLTDGNTIRATGEDLLQALIKQRARMNTRLLSPAAVALQRLSHVNQLLSESKTYF